MSKRTRVERDSARRIPLERRDPVFDTLSEQRTHLIQFMNNLNIALTALSHEAESTLSVAEEPAATFEERSSAADLLFNQAVLGKITLVEQGLVDADKTLELIDAALAAEPVVLPGVADLLAAVDTLVERAVHALSPRMNFIQFKALESTSKILNLASRKRVALYMLLTDASVDRVLGDWMDTSSRDAYIASQKNARQRISQIFPETLRLAMTSLRLETIVQASSEISQIVQYLRIHVFERLFYGEKHNIRKCTLDEALQTMREKFSSEPSACEQVVQALKQIQSLRRLDDLEPVYQPQQAVEFASFLVTLVYAIQLVKLEQFPHHTSPNDLHAYVRAVLFDIADVTHSELATQLTSHGAVLTRLSGGRRRV